MYSVIAMILMLGLFISTAAFSNMRDPTEPQWIYGEEMNGQSQGLGKKKIIPIVTAIFISGDYRTAIVDDKLVKVNDKVGNTVVKEIDPYSVILSGEGGDVVLYLLGTPMLDTEVSGSGK